jgi:SAM-dependent methyltransferase
MSASSEHPGILRALADRLPVSLRRFLAARFRRTIDRLMGSDRATIARRYIAGRGIEIGALSSPLTIPRSAKVQYVDRMPAGELREQYPELHAQTIVDTDVIADGERLESVGDSTQDFVIANHFIEHCQDPLGAIENMLRVLKPGGVLYLAIPDKRYTFDKGRPVASFEHLLRDHEEGPEWSRATHFEEWVTLVQKVADRGEAERQIAALQAADYSIHFHVWTQAEMFELLLVLKKRGGLEFEIESFLKNGGECIFVLRKE